MTCKIGLISTIKQLEEIKNDWVQFENIFLNDEYNYNIIYNWSCIFLNKENERFGYKKKLNIIILYQNNSILSILPLINIKRRIKKFFTYTSLEFIGSQFGCNNLGPIGEINNKNLDIILNWLNKNIQYDIINLGNQNKNNLSLYSLYSSYFYSIYPIINLKNFIDYNDYSKTKYNSNMRKNLKRRLKMLHNDDGELLIKKFQEISNKEFNEILKVSASKETEGKHDHFKDKDILVYIKNILSTTNHKIILAKLNNEIIGYQIIYLYKKYKIYSGLSYNRLYKKYGIGNLLEDYDIQNTKFNEYDYINMGPGLEKYKTYFSTDYQKIYCVLIRGNTFFSKLFFYFTIKKFKKLERSIESIISIN